MSEKFSDNQKNHRKKDRACQGNLNPAPENREIKIPWKPSDAELLKPWNGRCQDTQSDKNSYDPAHPLILTHK